MYIKFFIASMLVINSLVCMQQPEDPSMVKITQWQDMEQFAGQIITYKANSPYINDGNSYTIDIESVNFGQVSSYPLDWASLDLNDRTGFQLCRILKKSTISSQVCALINKHISQGFWARLATQEEIEKIKAALKNKQASWD